MLMKVVRAASALVTALGHSPRDVSLLARTPRLIRGRNVARQWPSGHPMNGTAPEPPNPLREYFDGHTEGPGIWKWRHYFDIYHRHFARFRGTKVVVAEIGVYSGGSMRMWRDYFGDRCLIHGIDLAPECRAYENAHTTIHVGDQADRAFWKRFRAAVPRVDILIDDGGHEVDQQMVTLEEMLPHLAPGGVFLCEDVHGSANPFPSFTVAMAEHLNAKIGPEDTKIFQTTPFQQAIASVHLYPYVVVIEKTAHGEPVLQAQQRGTQWQPFINH